MTPEQFGRLQSDVEHLSKNQEGEKVRLDRVEKWNQRAVGFIAAITFLTEVLVLWLELKGGHK